ncbi:MULTISPECIES: helix-turn-helix domain-containing protein [unclassified Rhizobium]|uniref:helix-turn-helix domain-containing protein n=1 Tax=unclassified Rhizobium TaxID=2613769 RepID=UPI0007159D7E|nr:MULTISPECIES: helix-turn-helix domain-containing protein [unclassified Rhizobium]KQS83143.1 transcriptional regulator [Rhizobium sp. Leaf386]KQS88970.1 transcriptional regulator [Rhizobium sp. Leaf391]KQT92818.1 transcriptional regulator [Rhizobium sp. Leaf453]
MFTSARNLTQPSTPAALRPLAGSYPPCVGQIALFAPDAEIFAQGERAGFLYRVEFGAIRVYRLHADGRRQIVAFHLAGETFGLEAGGTHSFFAETTVHTGLSKVSLAGEMVPQELMALALRSMLHAREHLLVVGRQSALERIGAFLVDIAVRLGDVDTIDLQMTRLDIGDYLGLTIETVSRSFSRLRDEGIVKFHGVKTIEIVQPERLALLCG